MAKSEKKRYICVFDCETVPDVAALRAAFGFEGDDAAVCEQASARQLERTPNSSFLPICFHKIVAISAVLADADSHEFVRVNTIDGADEREKIAKFLDFINRHEPLLVSFNGRGFDLPMMMIRAMRYNLAAPRYYDVRDKWNNYRTRYDNRFCIDLLDQLREFGAVSGGLRLGEVCKALGLPGKCGVDGGDVSALWLAGETARINRYCESDALNTYWLFLKFELLRGRLAAAGYRAALERMVDALAASEAEYAAEFLARLDAELKGLDGAVVAE